MRQDSDFEISGTVDACEVHEGSFFVVGFAFALDDDSLPDVRHACVFVG